MKGERKLPLQRDHSAGAAQARRRAHLAPFSFGGARYNAVFISSIKRDMSEHVQTRVANGTGIITLDRPKALNSLSLEMVRALTHILLAWRDDAAVDAVV